MSRLIKRKAINHYFYFTEMVLYPFSPHQATGGRLGIKNKMKRQNPVPVK